MKILGEAKKQEIIKKYVDSSSIQSKELLTALLGAVIANVELEIYKNN